MAMASRFTDTRTLTGFRRLPNSVNGGPRFVLVFADGEAKTSSDVSDILEVENIAGPSGSRCPVDVHVGYSGRGRINAIEAA